jgi:hypothetical protein
MNAYKLNGWAGHHYRMIIAKHLNIRQNEIYKQVKDIDTNGYITLHNGRRFRPELKEV